jgi:serine protease Do
MIPVNEDLIFNAVQNVSKAIVNIASVRTVRDQLFRVFPVEGVGSGGPICWSWHQVECGQWKP